LQIEQSIDMKQLIILITLCIFVPSSIFAWHETKIDTVEVRYLNGQLQEQYQTLYWGGNETTKKYGFFRSWHANGQLEWDGHYAEEAKVGAWVRWDSSDHRVEELSYFNGLQDGPEIGWNLDGTFRKLLHYRGGTLHGLCTWNKSGNLVNAFKNANDGLTVDSQSFYLYGDLLVPIVDGSFHNYEHPFDASRSPYYNSDLDLWAEWTIESSRINVGLKIDGKKDGLWILWNKSGDHEKSELYSMGEIMNTD